MNPAESLFAKAYFGTTSELRAYKALKGDQPLPNGCQGCFPFSNSDESIVATERRSFKLIEDAHLGVAGKEINTLA